MKEETPVLLTGRFGRHVGQTCLILFIPILNSHLLLNSGSVRLKKFRMYST